MTVKNNSINANSTTPLAVVQGGTGISSTTTNQLLYSSTTNTLAGLATAGNGVLITSSGGAPSISSTLPAAVQGNITTVGTVTSGTWNGGLITGTYGGTGVNNGASTITIGGSHTLSGAFTSTFTFTAATSVTFPTSGTLATTSQIPSTGTPLALNSGGTGADLTANNGGIFYSTASAGAILSGTATAGQLLTSGASTTPAWTTSTYPVTNAVNTLLYASSANVMAALATANSGVLITSSGGIPSIGTTLPIGVQTNITELGTVTTGLWNASLVTGTYGGTGVNNGASTITIGGSHTLSGAFTSTFTFTNTTSVTFPTTGTLVNSAVTTLSSLASVGTITTGSWSAVMQDYTETNTASSQSSTYAINLASGNVFSLTQTGNVTLSFSNVPAAGCVSITLFLIQDGTGSRIPSFPGSVIWNGGTAPTFTTTANHVDIVVMTTTNAGTTWRAAAVLNYSS